MSMPKSILAMALDDIVGLINPEHEEEFDPDKTIYNMRTKNIKLGTLLVVVESCSSSASSLVLVGEELCWVQSNLLSLDL